MWSLKWEQKRGEICGQYQPQISGLYIVKWIRILQVAGIINHLLSQQNSWGQISGRDFTWRSCSRSQNVFGCYRQYWVIAMQQHGSKGTCTAANSVVTFLGLKRIHSRVHQHTLGRKINTQIVSIHPSSWWAILGTVLIWIFKNHSPKIFFYSYWWWYL